MKHLDDFKNRLLEIKSTHPNTFHFVMDNLVRDGNHYLRCNRCGGLVLKETYIKEYPYQCVHCDENLYAIETFYGDEPSIEEICTLVEDTFFLVEKNIEKN